VVRGRAPAARTRARPRHGEEAWWCYGFGDDSVEGGDVKGGVVGGSPAYEEGGVGRSSGGEDSGSATTRRGGMAVLQLQQQRH
jgi:hypothetical protein